VLAASDLGWAPWLLLVEALGVALIVGFYRFEKAIEARGGTSLIDLVLLSEWSAAYSSQERFSPRFSG
jgi:hypothetical protein